MSSSDISVALITSPSDLAPAFAVNAAAFGTQTNDGIWTAIYPGWDTPTGKAKGISRLTSRFTAISKTATGEPTTIFLKATAPSVEDPNQRVIAGFAIWMQASLDPAYGEVPHVDEISDEELHAIYPDSEAERRYLRQVLTSLHRRRNEVIKEKAASSPPAVFVLDSCAVHPDYQRRGIASMLVLAGLAEAERRGLECVTEGSRMGRFVYIKEGFYAEGGDIEFDIDEEFARRERPPNLFLRNGRRG